ncbi:hypothetical protein SAY87_028841 [Trapa incisa]|uniref:Uncharacterized protein n=1 Tax=Trapa incisa TaxID=236973 RepID=A0AAN7QPQ4_9MYRT|nr:hypothetical protein SAY87_028841 [Trapa incisa]
MPFMEVIHDHHNRSMAMLHRLALLILALVLLHIAELAPALAVHPAVRDPETVVREVHELNKEVTKHEDAPESRWKNWNWRSEGDLLLNGAFFTTSGAKSSSSYAKASSLGARSSSLVSSLTGSAGALTCRKGKQC